MKRYLMTGMAAIMFCGVFTSCSHDMDLGDVPESKVIATYEEAFQARFGTPAADQDWGFGSSRALTRTADPRGNMWAAEGWNVPPVISNAQKDIVRRYFQQNTPLGYNDPGWSDFWIQQVYKGGTNTENGSQTTEKYTIGNGDEVTGGNHMDHLCSKSANGTEDHINDFNNSDNNDWEGRMLMVGSSTYTFGYINSNATAIHYDKAALVNWRVIAQWAVDNGLESSVEESVLNDGWNRSYMGFDWEQALPDDCYRPIYDYSAGWSADLPGGYPILGYETFEFDGKTYKLLSANSNQYAYDENEPKYHGIQNYNDKPSDAIIRELLSLGYLPYSDTLKDWIKLSTGSDGYYSDWIVTLTEAKKDNTPSPSTKIKKLRVIAEDLSVGENSDFDFNDVVFDVIWTRTYSDETYTTLTSQTVEIELLAAGGTLPLYVDGNEVHEKFGVDTKVMVNTNAGAKGLNGRDNISPVKWNVPNTNWSGDNIGDIANSIEVKVTKNGTDYPISAVRGKIASKIGVGTDYNWCNERQDIEAKYNLSNGDSPFRDWVQHIYPDNDWYIYAPDKVTEYRNKLNGAQGNQQP